MSVGGNLHIINNRHSIDCDGMIHAVIFQSFQVHHDMSIYRLTLWLDWWNVPDWKVSNMLIFDFEGELELEFRNW